MTSDAAFGCGLAALFVLVAFVTTGGTDLGPNTWMEIAAALLAAAAAAAVIVIGAPGRAWGGVTLLLFAALAALTFASIAWSVQPDNSWVEANRTVAYLAAFATAIALARLLPERWPALLGAVATAATVICGWALLVKVFPASLDANDPVARLRAPFDYWNATGLLAAMGLPPCIWAGARPSPGRILRALSVPALAILASVVVLSYSRGALIAAIVACGCWFAFTPLRLRAALVLGLGAVGRSGYHRLGAVASRAHPRQRDAGRADRRRPHVRRRGARRRRAAGRRSRLRGGGRDGPRPAQAPRRAAGSESRCSRRCRWSRSAGSCSWRARRAG